ncbi:MAG: hypothetical protein COA58_13235 [Bacteroidetes bacterium]|nr:MAG: hypothetical protein COA58_13235 [Bacteroidota bacterium]
MQTIKEKYKKRYRNYIIGISIYTGVFVVIILLGGEGSLFTKIGLLFLLEDIFLPGSVVLANYLFDIKVGEHMPKNGIGKKVLIKVAISLVVICLATIFMNELGEFIGFYDDDTLAFGTMGEVGPYWTNVITNIVITLIFTIPAFYREGYIDAGKDKLKEEREKVQNLSEELNVLQLQLYTANVKPHFIFNTLNSVLTLIYDSPEKAEDLVIHLSDFLRRSLYSSTENDHSMAEELDAVINYLQIEKIRFGDAVDYDVVLSDEAAFIKTPKFFLLPIVENALKHNRENPDLSITVKAYVKDEMLVAEVMDTGKPFPEEMNWNSGLKGTDSMLQSYYKGGYAMHFSQTPNKMVRITINLKEDSNV